MVGDLKDKRIFVTGGGGFIGRAVCRAAVAAGARVFALHRRPLAGMTNAPGVTTRFSPSGGAMVRVVGDLTDLRAVHAALDVAEPQMVIHAAGRASAERSMALLQPTLHNNLLATVNLLTAAAERGVGRVVLAGSVESPTGVVDAAEITPSSPYAASKFAEAVYARVFHRQFGLDIILARLAVTYGREDRPSKLLRYVVDRLREGEPAELSSGRRRADWVYIDDAAEGLLACTTVSPQLAGHTIDIGTGVLTSVADVAKRLGRLFGRPELIRLGVLADRKGEQESAADAEATEQLIGWRAKVALEDGLRRLVTDRVVAAFTLFSVCLAA